MGSCELHNFLRRTSPDMYTPSECFDSEDLQNGTVTAGLKSNPSIMATLKRGNNRKHQLTGKEVSLWNTSTTKAKCRGKTTVYNEVFFIKKPLFLNYLVYTLRILQE